jgi:hypothetical protein
VVAVVVVVVVVVVEDVTNDRIFFEGTSDFNTSSHVYSVVAISDGGHNQLIAVSTATAIEAEEA